MFLNHITKPAGTNAPGVSNEILLAPKSWFATISQAPASPTAAGDSLIITANHTFNTVDEEDPALGFVKMYTTPRTGEFKFTMVGDIDSYGYNNVVEAWSPGINPVLWELMIEQDDYIVLVKDSECAVPRYFQLGSSCSPALKREWEFATGKEGGEGKKGTTVKFDSYSSRPQIYTGAITLAEQAA